MLDDERLTMADLVTVGQLGQVIADAVAQAPIGMRVIDTDGRLLVECHAQADPCPQLSESAAVHRAAPIAWLGSRGWPPTTKQSSMTSARLAPAAAPIRSAIVIGCGPRL